MKNAKTKSRRKINTKFKTVLLTLLAAMLAVSGIVTANAATIKDDGEYALVLYAPFEARSGCIDGEYSKLIKFNVASGETTVKLSELTKDVTLFNGENEFSYWETADNVKVGDELALSDFNRSGDFYTSSGEEIKYDKGLIITARFEGKALKDTGNYYVNLDGFAGKVNGKAKMLLQGKLSEFKTIDLTQYVAVRPGFNFVGWDLGGKLVTSVDASAFANGTVTEVTATYTCDTYVDDVLTLVLHANGGTIDGKDTNKYNYLGGANSGTSMSLLPYVPVREGYIFNGWNTRPDGSGNNCKYMYWREWDKDEKTDKKYVKDTLISDNGYERYKNINLYAVWTAEPNGETKSIQSTDKTKTSIEFTNGISNTCTLQIQEVEVKKSLAEQNVKFIADINVMDGDTVVRISDNKMRIKLALPEQLKGYDKYEVVYISGDEIKERIPAVTEDGYIIFETNHLSQYGIVATNNGAIIGTGTQANGNNQQTDSNADTADSNRKTVQKNSPDTGCDNAFLWEAFALIGAGLLLFAPTVFKRKRFNG